MRVYEEERASLSQAQQTTLAALVAVDERTLMRLTKLTLPEIRAIKEEVARILPAGNLPAFILSGLVRLKGRYVTPEHVRRDLSALLRGLDLLPKGLYGLLVAGPATVLYAYQKLLQLAGKDVEAAFPYGTWQFYLEFGMREDTAHSAVEATGFHRAVFLRSDEARMAAAWLYAALTLLYEYDDLLATDWRERVMLRTLYQVAEEAQLAGTPAFAGVFRAWETVRPYHHPPDADYLPYRRMVFNRFLEPRLRALPPRWQAEVHRRYAGREAQELAAYQEQMTLLCTLTPEPYMERRTPVPLWRASVGFIWGGYTYLLPACVRDAAGSPLCYPPEVGASPFPLYALDEESLCDGARRPLRVDRRGEVTEAEEGRVLGYLRPPSPGAVLGWVQAVLAHTPAESAPVLDVLLVCAPRAEQARLRRALPDAVQRRLERLRRAPILINWDLHDVARPLAVLRRDHRGIGDHAMTVFRTAESVVFDLSHIFFDGVWGGAVAEILTQRAAYVYAQLEGVAPVAPTVRPRPLKLYAPEVEARLRELPPLAEAAAESEAVDMEQLVRLRRWLKQRGVRLTVNDLLLLYRFLHALRYRLSERAQGALEAFRRMAAPVADQVREEVARWLRRTRETPPVLLIPMDATRVSPRERIYPTTFRNPLTEIPDLLEQAQRAYEAYRAAPSEVTWEAFDVARRELLAYLKAFGELLDALKGVTMRGESFNTATIRLLAHLPPSMQRLLDAIPQKFSVLNEIIKGNEVFSNLGRVPPGSSLRRFISARDDGSHKALVWGVLTDDEGRMHISLRDFRPFVRLLAAAGGEAVAHTLAQDYLDAYVEGFNDFVKVLSKVVAMRRKGPDRHGSR